jgi:hypothetical protein
MTWQTFRSRWIYACLGLVGFTTSATFRQPSGSQPSSLKESTHLQTTSTRYYGSGCLRYHSVALQIRSDWASLLVGQNDTQRNRKVANHPSKSPGEYVLQTFQPDTYDSSCPPKLQITWNDGLVRQYLRLGIPIQGFKRMRCRSRKFQPSMFLAKTMKTHDADAAASCSKL